MSNIELEFIKTYANVNQKTGEFKHKLGAMRDMCDSCKLGVSEHENVLYIDKPSIFQGVSRWFYGQNRAVITQYLYKELMESDGLLSLVKTLRDKCAELFMYCPTSGTNNAAPARSTPTSTSSSTYGVHYYHTLSVSNNTRNVFKSLCVQNIELLNIVAHGLGKLYVTYEMDTPNRDSDGDAVHVPYFHDPARKCSLTERVVKYIQEMQKRVKFERVMLENIVEKFNAFTS
jgi:hypothetical protein